MIYSCFFYLWISLKKRFTFRYLPLNTIELLLFPLNMVQHINDFILRLSSFFFKLVKNTLLSCPYFVNKTLIFSKTQCSHVIFCHFSWKKRPLSSPHMGKKLKFCQSYAILIIDQKS